MAGIIGNDSTTKVLKTINNYTGLANLKVIAINPTKDELSKILGGADVKEPEYLNLDLNKDGVLQNKIVFWLANKQLVIQKDGTKAPEEIKTRVEFLVAPRERMNKEGTKNQIVNRRGQTCWLTVEAINTNDNMSWFRHEPYHNAFIGEEILLNFVRNWMNLAADADCNFENPTKIFSGDVTELKNMLKARPNNEVTVYLDVTSKDDKYYQAVYSKAFSRPLASNPEAVFAKAFKEEYGAPKTKFKDFTLRVFTPDYNIDSPDSEQSNTGNKFFV